LFQEESSKDESEFVDDYDDNGDDDDNSWGVVFTADDIDTTDGLKGTKTKKRRPTPVRKTSSDEKVIRCKIVEVDELDTDEEELPCVVGMAATPPQAAASYRQRKRSTNLRLKNFVHGDKVDRKRFPDKANGLNGHFPAKTNDVTASKFFIGSSSELSSCSGKSKAKVHKKK
jgi:hypothetical protein